MKDLITNLRTEIFFYLNHFEIYDYIAISLVLATFLVLLILAAMTVLKHEIIGTFLFLLAVGFLFFGLFFAYKIVDSSTRTRQISINELKQLQYSDVFIVDLNLTNLSKRDFNFCRVNVKFHKNGKNALREFLNSLKPFKNRMSELNTTIAPHQSHNIKMVIKDFRPSDFNVVVNSECF